MLCSYLYQSICNIVLRRYYCWVYFFLVIKSGKSFVKIGSRSQIARFFLFYCNPHSHLFRTSPRPSIPPARARPHTHTHTLIWFYLIVQPLPRLSGLPLVIWDQGVATLTSMTIAVEFMPANSTVKSDFITFLELQ